MRHQKFVVGWLTNELVLFHFTIPFCFSPLKGRTMSAKWHKVWYWVDVSLNPNLAINCLNSLGAFSYTLKDGVLHSCDSGQCGSCQFSSGASDSLQPHELQHARLPCPSPTPKACSNSCPLSRWCRPTISYSVIPFSFHLQSWPASGSFPVNRLFSSGGQSFGVTASASVLPMNTQDWSPLGWTVWISLQSKGLSRVCSPGT